MLVGDCPHHIPLQNKISVLAFEKSQNPSIFMALNSLSKISAISNGSAPESGFKEVQGIFTEPGIVPFLTQSWVRESITNLDLSPFEICFR